ncbi:MAG: glycyl radical protein [Desulfobacterales bacterium]
MTPRIERLRARSLEAPVTLSIERALLVTDAARRHLGRHATPVMRALIFRDLLARKTIFLGEDELIVGERGPAPKAVPTFPEWTCHRPEDLRVLDSRPRTAYRVAPGDIARYESEVIPFWEGRTVRERIFAEVSPEWRAAYEAGVFTEFMEQRAPGHTALDGLIYRRGLLDLQAEIAARLAALDDLTDPEAGDRAEQLRAMDIACGAVIAFAERHAARAEEEAARHPDPARRAELLRIAAICRRVPAQPPRDFWEALQAYWFVHLAAITELNGWDAMSPGHLDQHLQPFYERGIREGTLTREQAKELLSCFWIKVNNHPAPPKVGVTASESGTYNDFTQINLGGLTAEGESGACELTELILEAASELRLLQPQPSLHLSRITPERYLLAACRVIREGHGWPSVFNADLVVQELLGAGKTLEDAREGGTSGCIETGAFGKEAYILTGYLNVPKLLELALNDGCDLRTGKPIGPRTGRAETFDSFDRLYGAFEAQLRWAVELKVGASHRIERIVARMCPAPFLSVLIRDCIARGRDYTDGGPRYNTSFIACVGIGTTVDALSAVRTHVYEKAALSLPRLVGALARDFAGEEPLRLALQNRTPRYGNDDERADRLLERVYRSLLQAIDGRPNTRGGRWHLNLLSTTCHVYFGRMLAASADGRRAGEPVSDGASPAQGADRSGPTAVLRSLARIDQARSGGTLLNLRFLPDFLKSERDLAKLASLIRTYFRLNGHHVQFNIVDDATLRRAQRHPREHRDLLVRVAGYSDFFVDLEPDIQEEIIRRTAHSG